MCRIRGFEGQFTLPRAREGRGKSAGNDPVRVTSPWLSFDLEFVGCPKIPVALAAILRGWDFTRAPASTREKLEFRWSGRRLHWHSTVKPVPRSWRRLPPANVFDAVCDIHYEMSDWFLLDHPGHLGLHSAAVEFGKGLVVFPSTVKAGKSVLTIACAAAGLRVYGDDVLAIHPKTNEGISLGMLPRLRLPLPDSGGNRFREFVAARSGPENKRHRYINLTDTEMAPLGAAAPIAGFVLLDRQQSGPAALGPVSHGEMLKCAISRNFAGAALRAADIFVRAEKLTANARRYRLTYTDCDQAIELLAKHFGWPKSATTWLNRIPVKRSHPRPAPIPTLESSDISSHILRHPGEGRDPPKSNEAAQSDAWMGPGLRRDDGVHGDRRSEFPRLGIDSPPPTSETAAARRRTRVSSKLLVQTPGIEFHHRGADNFLIDKGHDAIHHLNELGAAVWHLFAEARRPAEIVALVQAAFPGVPDAKIRSDLEHLIAGMLRSGVLRACRRS